MTTFLISEGFWCKECGKHCANELCWSCTKAQFAREEVRKEFEGYPLNEVVKIRKVEEEDNALNLSDLGSLILSGRKCLRKVKKAWAIN